MCGKACLLHNWTSCNSWMIRQSHCHISHKRCTALERPLFYLLLQFFSKQRHATMQHGKQGFSFCVRLQSDCQFTWLAKAAKCFCRMTVAVFCWVLCGLHFPQHALKLLSFTIKFHWQKVIMYISSIHETTSSSIPGNSAGCLTFSACLEWLTVIATRVCPFKMY